MNNVMTIHRLFWVWDFEKEEDWLNEMAMNGWVLDGVGLCTFRFRACERGEYVIRLEARDDDSEYLELMSEIGAEYIGRMVQWIYFRRKAEMGEFQLFSDLDSRISHLDRIGKVLVWVGMANLALGVSLSLQAHSLGWINLLCCALLMYALGRIHGEKESLKRDRMLRE